MRRRDFLKAVGGAAFAAAIPSEGAAADYGAAVRSTGGLVGYWPFDGDTSDPVGKANGTPQKGTITYVATPVGTRAALLEGGAFVAMGQTPQLDTDDATVELLFQVSRKPDHGYNPCLVAKRSTSEVTRWSIHVMADLKSIAMWNGGSVSLVEPPDGGVIGVGEWHHLAITSASGGRLHAYLDGVECDFAGPPGLFASARKGLPLQVGASTPNGDETGDFAVAHLAIYSTAVPATVVAAHVDAAGWAARRAQLAERKKTRDEEKRRMAEAQAKERAKKTGARLNDRNLMARGRRRVYSGDHLGAIDLGLGGIGAGEVHLNGKAEFTNWQIFGNHLGLHLPDTFLAVGAGGVVRACQTAKAGPFEPMKALTFSGEYPFGWFEFEDPGLPVQVSMQAFSPLIPLNERDSSLPCAVLELTIANPSKSEVQVQVAASCQNAVGIQPGQPILARRNPGYGGNRNEAVASGTGMILRMTGPNGPAEGSMGLHMQGPGVTCLPDVGGMQGLRDAVAGQATAGQQTAGPSKPGETISGALVRSLSIRPGAKATVRVLLAWHFPNQVHGDPNTGWSRKGCRYAEVWPDVLAVLDYVNREYRQLAGGTRLYHSTLYESNLPHWMLDRISSQVAILRSKTCFCSADGYFGGWEGCAPDTGCCFGNCDHVWHYAQAHARLFPTIARRMREQVLSAQLPDGGLPHRQPHEFPAADGQYGEILEAYREHQMSADSQWLRTWWPHLRKAMEYGIKTWDVDENGVPAGAQWNTLDGALGGATTWIGGLYLTALRASAEMAELQGEKEIAARYRRIAEKGAKAQDKALFNGDYYIQLRDAEARQDYGNGCAIDQCLGEWWAGQVNLPTSYPRKHVVSAMKSLIQHNFRGDFRGVHQAPRKFVADEDGGLQMIQWPDGDRPNPCILYGDEVMTGFEYSAAALMVQVGLLREGFAVVKTIADRYDGRLREGLTPGGTASWGYSGNPFGDDECGKYYARAMSSWSLLVAAQGLDLDAPKRHIGFRPVWQPGDHATFFSTGESWGLFSQVDKGAGRTCRLKVTYGALPLKTLGLVPPALGEKPKVRVLLSTTIVSATVTATDGGWTITFPREITVKAGQTLKVEMG